MMKNDNEIRDELIIELYSETPDKAIEYTEKKYGKLCRKLISNYLHVPEDAEECYNDFLLNMWKTILARGTCPTGLLWYTNHVCLPICMCILNTACSTA